MSTTDVEPTSERMPSLNDEAIEELEREMLTLPQVSAPVTHRFGPGVYIREVFLPAGSAVVGHHQNFPHMNVMVKGRVTMLTKEGKVELEGYNVFVSEPGRKIGYIHEDVIWQNVYATDETDVEKLEAYYLTKSDSWKHADEINQQLLDVKDDSDREDYLRVLEEFGFTHEVARAQSENTDDMTDLPQGSYKIRVGDSRIEGKGILATGEIKAGEVIAPARIDGKRTIAGRYTNHSARPNARMVRGKDSNIYLAALRDIAGNRAGFDGEEVTINYRDALNLNRSMEGST